MLLTALTFAGCGDAATNDDQQPQCDGGKCDNAEDDDADGPAVRCDALVEDRSGNDLTVEDIMANDDPIAELILSSEAARCPMSVADIVEELKAAGCSGHASQFVSERSQILGMFTDYRSVTEFKCDGKRVFLHYPLLASDIKDIEFTEQGPRLGQGVNQDRLLAKLDHTFPAIISENESGIFNFYQSRSIVNRVCTPQGGFAVEEGFPADPVECETTAECGEGEECTQRPDDLGVVADFRFFGNSMDFVNLDDRRETLRKMANALPGPVTTEADIEHSLEIDRNCAVCHPGGGLTMRELKSPWIHWEAGGHFASPQTDEIMSKAADVLGTKRNGASFEGTVRDGNGSYTDARVDLALKLLSDPDSGYTTGDFFRPLLCTDEFNLLTSGSRPGVDFTSIRFRDAVLDEKIAGFDSIPTSHEKFLAHLEQADWQLWGFRGGVFQGLLQLLGKEVPRETLGTFTFVERANIDQLYIDNLKRRGILDADLLNDTLAIDFTRAVFSEDRCGLVDAFDQIEPSVFVEDGRAKPDAAQAIRDALIAVLTDGTDTAAEADYLALLQEPGGDAKALASAFVGACKARDPDAVLDDYLTYVAQVAKRAADQEASLQTGEAAFLMYRFPGSNGFMMASALGQGSEPGLRFHPDTCELTTDYVGRGG